MAVTVNFSTTCIEIYCRITFFALEPKLPISSPTTSIVTCLLVTNY